MVAVGDAALGAVFGALLQAIITAKKKAAFFKKTLQQLESTLNSVQPIICEILKTQNNTTDTFRRIMDELEKARVLVEMYYDIKKWKLLKKRKVKKLIQDVDSTLQMFLSRDFQAEQSLSLAKIDTKVTEMNKKMDHIINVLGRNGIHSLNGGSEEITSPSTSSSPSIPESNTSKPSFELRWQIKKDKYLNICLGRHHN